MIRACLATAWTAAWTSTSAWTPPWGIPALTGMAPRRAKPMLRHQQRPTTGLMVQHQILSSDPRPRLSHKIILLRLDSRRGRLSSLPHRKDGPRLGGTSTIWQVISAPSPAAAALQPGEAAHAAASSASPAAATAALGDGPPSQYCTLNPPALCPREVGAALIATWVARATSAPAPCCKPAAAQLVTPANGPANKGPPVVACLISLIRIMPAFMACRGKHLPWKGQKLVANLMKLEISGPR